MLMVLPGARRRSRPKKVKIDGPALPLEIPFLFFRLVPFLSSSLIPSTLHQTTKSTYTQTQNNVPLQHHISSQPCPGQSLRCKSTTGERAPPSSDAGTLSSPASQRDSQPIRRRYYQLRSPEAIPLGFDIEPFIQTPPLKLQFGAS